MELSKVNYIKSISITILMWIIISLSSVEINGQSGIDTNSFDMIKPDFMVNELDGTNTADQRLPNIAQDGNGNYAVVWEDYRNGLKDIYAQFFNSNDERIGMNIRVNEIPIIWNGFTSISGDPNGGFLIAWTQDYNRILFQRFTTEGVKAGEIVLVNYSLNGSITENPVTAINKNGNFIITWMASTGYGTGLYYKVYDKQGIEISTEISITDSYQMSLSSMGKNNIATDESGNFLVVWSSYKGDRSKIFLQVLSSEGHLISTYKTVSIISDQRRHISPSISSTTDGIYLIAWVADNLFRVSNGIAGRLCNNDGTFLTEQFSIAEAEMNYDINFHAASDGIDRFVVFHESNKTKYSILQKDGQVLASGSIGLNLPAPGNITISNVIANKNSIYLALPFYNLRNYDVYLQKFDYEVNALQGSVKINDDTLSSFQTDPEVYFNQNGESIIIWTDKRNNHSELYAQVYDKYLNPVRKNILLSPNFNGSSAAAYLSDGTFVIAYGTADHNSIHEVYLTKITVLGEISGKVKIKEHHDDLNPEISINDDDEIFICMFHSPVHTLYFKKYDGNFSLLSSERIITVQKNGFTPGAFGLSVNKNFKIFTTWINLSINGGLDGITINGLIYNEKGESVTDTLIFKDIAASGVSYRTYNKLDDDDNYIVIMNDLSNIYVKRGYGKNHEHSLETSFRADALWYNNPQILSFQNYKSFITWNFSSKFFGSFLDDSKRKNDTFGINSLEDTQITSGTNKQNAALFQNKLFVVYQSRKYGGTGFDIWANVQMTEKINFEQDVFFPPVNDDVLYLNYPNPFNAQTKIVYEILAYHPVKLTVYDILGREVQVLVNENQEKGLYEVNFNASELASGIYFYRLEAFRTITRKMIIIK